MSSEGFGAFDHRKYPIYQPLKKADRRWLDQVLTKAPEWCSVDLRDGNQALIEPMTSDKKLRLWELLVDLGFKQIEVGFPSASSHDFDFLRKLIEEDRIPSDVTVQVLTQAREELITRTFEALKGCRRAVCIFITAHRRCSVIMCSGSIAQVLQKLLSTALNWSNLPQPSTQKLNGFSNIAQRASRAPRWTLPLMSVTRSLMSSSQRPITR